MKLFDKRKENKTGRRKFYFCGVKLFSYKRKDDKRVGIISGFNIRQEWQADKHDYFFSKLGAIWGWATWKRVYARLNIKVNVYRKLFLMTCMNNNLSYCS